MIRLKEIREYQGISQKSLANLLNVSPSNIYNYETGRTEPSTDILCKLANLLNVTVDYLVGNDDAGAAVPRSANDAAMPGTLSDDEKELLKVFRGLSATGKKTLIGSAHNIEKYDPQAAAKKKA